MRQSFGQGSDMIGKGWEQYVRNLIIVTVLVLRRVGGSARAEWESGYRE